jgi:hypothetical protein
LIVDQFDGADRNRTWARQVLLRRPDARPSKKVKHETSGIKT